MGAASLGAQALQFVVSIAMARLLLPSQFGEATLAYSITGFAMIFTDLGLTAAVVHADRVTEELLSSAFWLSALTGFALTIATCALAFPLAALYGQPELIGLLIVVSFNFTLSCGAAHLALLERSLNFRRIAIIETVGAVVATLTAPIAALLGFGVYSLVLGPLLGTCLRRRSFGPTCDGCPDAGQASKRSASCGGSREDSSGSMRSTIGLEISTTSCSEERYRQR